MLAIILLQVAVELKDAEALAHAAQLGHINGRLLDVHGLLVQQLPLCMARLKCQGIHACLKRLQRERFCSAAPLHGTTLVSRHSCFYDKVSERMVLLSHLAVINSVVN